MVKNKYSKWLNKPKKIGNSDLDYLYDLIKTYPFCTTSRLLYLKGLQNTNNIKYNQALKETAAYSGDRSRLFYFLSEHILHEIKIDNPKEKIDSKLRNSDLTIEQELDIGQPLQFNIKEKHSFNEWLKLSQTKPIKRIQDPRNSLSKKVRLIEEFITKRNKVPNKKFYSASEKAKESVKFEFNIITETLAKVYVEQGYYEKAIVAYQQLCLKYPKKSALFATQIKLINQLISNKK